MDLGVACNELIINRTIEIFTTPTVPSQNCCNTSATQNNTPLVTPKGGVVTPTVPSQISYSTSTIQSNTKFVTPEGGVDTTVLGAVTGVLGVLLLLALALIGCIIVLCFITQRRKSTSSKPR